MNTDGLKLYMPRPPSSKVVDKQVSTLIESGHLLSGSIQQPTLSLHTKWDIFETCHKEYNVLYSRKVGLLDHELNSRLYFKIAIISSKGGNLP